MKKPSMRSILLILFVLLGLILTAVFPLTPLRKPIEDRLSASLGGKVRVESIHINYLPTPAFTLNALTIDSADEASIDQVVIPISPRNLLSFGLALHDVRLKGAVFSQRFALSLPQKMATDSYSLRIDKILLDNVSLRLETGIIGPFQAQLAFKGNGQIENLSITSPDGKAELDIQPVDSATFAVQFSAQHWTLPSAYPVNFEYLNMTGQANRSGLQITNVHAGLYNGVVTGSAELAWGKDWLLDGQLQARNIHAEPLISVFSPATRASGILRGEGKFRFKANQYSTLFDDPILQGRFAIQDGIVHNLDLVTPLKSTIPQTLHSGGQTRFDQLSGTFAMQGETVRLSRLQLDAGKFKAQGDLSVRQGQLSGGAHVSLGADTLVANNQLTLSGSLSAPELRSGGAWRPQAEGGTDF